MYYKIIGNNRGHYPYRVGLNTLKYNGETFDATAECTPGGLYYCEAKYIFDYLLYGYNLCYVTIPANAQVVKVGNKFKADRIIIEKILSLSDVSTWKYLIALGVDIHIGDDL